LVPDKDHDTLIRAFALAAAQYPEAELWLVGDGPLLPSLQRLAAETAPLGKVRFFPGQIDLQPFFRRADVFVLSSIYEAMPNVVLEAMAAGLPVVATRVGGLAELVTPGENGWLVPPQDPAALAAALTKLLSETETRQRFGHAGRRRVAQGFSLEVMVQRHEAVFQELTDRN
jgi:glycosyltransferase involved in cell wall biosynthesis